MMNKIRILMIRRGISKDNKKSKKNKNIKKVLIV